MKKIFAIAPSYLVVIILSSFLSKVEKKVPTGTSMVMPVQYSAWSPWTKVSCYKGIQFRTAKGEFYMDKYMWHVQFRNLYNKEVRFSYNIVEPEKEAITRQEQNILDVWRLGANFDPDEEGNNRDAPHGGNWTRSAGNVFVYITNVQFSNNGNWDNTFINCDY